MVQRRATRRQPLQETGSFLKWPGATFPRAPGCLNVLSTVIYLEVVITTGLHHVQRVMAIGYIGQARMSTD